MSAEELSPVSDVPTIGIVMPVLNEMSSMPCLLPYLESLDVDELVIVDGGSHDGSPQALKAAGIHVLNSEPGRASQMNLGAEVLKSDYVIFLHADTRLPINFHSEIRDLWGRFDVRFDSELLSMGVIAWFMNMRSRFTNIATGDQAIFVRRELFESVGGFKELAIMEDIDLSRALAKHAKPYASRAKVTTSARRWEQDGVIRTILLMWRLRLAFTFGARPSLLKHSYRDVR